MQKMYALIIVIIMIILSLAACDPSNKDEPEVSSSSSESVSSGNSTVGDPTTDSSATDSTAAESSATKGESSSSGSLKTGDKSVNGISVNVSVQRPRDDVDEFRSIGNAAEKWKSASGGANTETAELRKKILNSQNTSKTWSGTTYYISPGGDNLNDGKSPEKAIRTISAINTLSLQPGDALLFERGGIWRVSEQIWAKAGVTYGSYGTGEKPTIYGSPINYARKELWEPSKMSNVWKVDFPYFDAGVIVFNHGEDVGTKKGMGLVQLTKNGDYYHNSQSGILYLYYDKGNPASFYKDIAITQKGTIFGINVNVSNVTFDNLCLKYSGAYAIRTEGGNNNVKITNCEIGWIGGSKFNETTFYGNAIELWDSAKNITVENNWIYQTFDSALSPQGSGDYFENIHFLNNLLEYNNTHIEMWVRSQESKITGFRIEGNIMRFASMGFGSLLEGTGARGIEGCICFPPDGGISSAVITDISIKNNIFDTAYYYLVNWNLPSKNQAGIKISGNTYYANSNRRYAHFDLVIFDGVRRNASNQAELEETITIFDKSPKLVKWLG